jgi:type VI secretion system protein ImpH
MAGADGGSPPDLKNDLFQAPKRYSFFQAIRLLRLLLHRTDAEGEHVLFHDLVRIRPLLSLSFPGTDIYSLERRGDDEAFQYTITATFLGLYGAASPLPTHYTEDLLDEASEDKTVTRDFLDIFNQPFYHLFFKAWSKYRWPLNLIEIQDDEYYERLYSLLGLAETEFRDRLPEARRLLRYIGLFTQFPRSALGLKTLLADALNVPRVDVAQAVLTTVEIPQPQRCFLGRQGHRLGMDCYVGQWIEDQNGKFRLEAGPMSEERFHALLPGRPDHDELKALTRAYLNQPLEYDLKLMVRAEEVSPATPGGGLWSALGFDTWVFAGNRLERDGEVVFPMGEAN